MAAPSPERLGPQLPEPLWRQVLGEQLRRRRLHRGETLHETADRAGVSPQYLSEMERGVKEPSSEMIAAVAGALDTSLAELTIRVARRLAAGADAAQSQDRAAAGAESLAVVDSLAATEGLAAVDSFATAEGLAADSVAAGLASLAAGMASLATGPQCRAGFALVA